jgi:hypothetical protein
VVISFRMGAAEAQRGLRIVTACLLSSGYVIPDSLDVGTSVIGAGGEKSEMEGEGP